MRTGLEAKGKVFLPGVRKRTENEGQGEEEVENVDKCRKGIR